MSVYTGSIESHVLYVWKDEVIIIQNCNYPECLFWKFYECNQTFQDYSKSPTTYEKWIFQQYNWNLHTIKSAIIPHPPYLHIRQYSYLIFYPGTTSTQNILAYTYWPKTWLQKLSNILPPRNYVYSKHFGLYILTKDLTAKVKQHLVKLNFWSQVKLHKMLKDQSTVGVVFCRQFSLNKNRYYVWNKIENSLL